MFDEELKTPANAYIGGNAYPKVSKTYFVKNKETGKAEIYVNDDLFYKGYLHKGEYHGKGTLYYDDDKVLYKEDFDGGVFHGQGKLYNEDGTLALEGIWKMANISGNKSYLKR